MDRAIDTKFMEETHCCKATIEVVQAPLSSRHTQWKEVQVLLLEAMEMLEGFLEEIRQKPSVPRSSSSMHEQLQPTSPADSCSDGITENSLVKAMEDDQLLILEGGASITKNLSDQIDAENETRKLFDELTQLVDEDLDADSLLQSQEETIFEQDVGDSEYEALKMFDKSTEPLFTGSKSISGQCYPFSTIAEVDFSSPKAGIQQMNKAEELFPSKVVVVKVAYRMFDEMPKPISIKTECLSTGHHLFDEMPILFSVKENDKSKGREKLGLRVAELSRVLSFKEDASETSKFIFDPGGSFESNVEKKTPDKFSGNALKIGSGIDVMRKSHYEPVLPTCDVMNQGNKFAHAPILALGETLDNRRVYMRNVLNGMLMFVFDPGGSSWLHNGCDSFRFTDDKQHFDNFSENYSQNELGRGWQVAGADKLEGLMLIIAGGILESRDLDVDDMTSGAKRLVVPWALAVGAELGGQDKNCGEIEVFINVDCNPLESNNEEQDFDKLMRINVDSHRTTFRWESWPKVATELGLFPLMLIHFPQSAKILFSLVTFWAFGCLHLADAVNANVLNVELWLELYKAFQIEIQAAFCTVTSWIGSGSSTTISTGVRLVPLITLALGGKNWWACNAAYFHLTQEHIPTAFWGTLVDWCQYGRVSGPLGKGFRFVTGASQGQDNRVGNIIPTAKAGGAAILYDWDAQNVYVVMKLPQEYMETEAREVNNSGMAELTPLVALFINQVHIIELYEAVIAMVTLDANTAVVPYVMEIEDCSLIINVENFIWDPGWCVIFFL